MLKLVASSEEGIGARIPVRWCISKDTLGELAEENAVKPHLLVVVTYDDREIERRLIPLENMMDYFDFHRAGDHKIFAKIVWHRNGDLRTLKAVVLGGRAHGRKYPKVDVLDYEGNLATYRLVDCVHSLEEEAELTVSVAAGHFAKKPSRFEQWWVNLWYQSAPRDQCAFRKRRFLAYSVQPLIVLLFVVFITAVRTLAAAGLISIAKRGINFKAIIHPWNFDADDVWLQAKHYYGTGTFFTKTYDKKERPYWYILLTPFTPIVGVVGFLIALAINLVKNYNYSLLELAAIGIGFQAAICVFFCLLILVGEIYDRLLLPLFAKVKRSLAKFFGYRQVWRVLTFVFFVTPFAAVWYLYGFQMVLVIFYVTLSAVVIITLLWCGIRIFDEAILSRARPWNPDETPSKLAEQYRGYEALLCDNRPLKVSIRALPRERQTVYLRFQDFKTKVCKPFALG